MPAAIWKLRLEEGSDLNLVVTYENRCGDPIDVTGYGARLAIRNNPDDPNPLITITQGAGITLAGTTGEFTLIVSAASVNAIKHTIQNSARYSFTIWPTASTPSVNPIRLLEGPVTYSRDYGAS